MRAVYGCSDSPYLTLSKGEALYELVPRYGDRIVGQKGEFEFFHNVIGMVKSPVSGVFQFMRGTLTLTDPTEIKGMREYIKRRRDGFITELSFEGDEAELEDISYIKASPTDPQRCSEVPQGIPQGIPQRRKVNRADEWDYKMAQRLRR